MGGGFAVGRSAFLVPIEDGLHLFHDDFVGDVGAGIGDGGFDLRTEPCVVGDRVFRRHKVRRRVEIRGIEAFKIWRIVGHGGTIAQVRHV